MKVNDACHHCSTNKLWTIYRQPLQKLHRKEKSKLLEKSQNTQSFSLKTDQCDQFSSDSQTSRHSSDHCMVTNDSDHCQGPQSATGSDHCLLVMGWTCVLHVHRSHTDTCPQSLLFHVIWAVVSLVLVATEGQDTHFTKEPKVPCSAQSKRYTHTSEIW